MLSSNNIKNIGIFGTFIIISTAYFLHANTFFNELNGDLKRSETVKKDNISLNTSESDISKVEIDLEEKEKSSKENIEIVEKTTDKIIEIEKTIDKVVEKSIDNSIVVTKKEPEPVKEPVSSKKVVQSVQTTTLTNDDKLNKLLKEYKYIYLDSNNQPTVESKKALEKLLPLLSSLDEAYIEIEGHSSSQGYDYLTQKNSEKLANSIYKYLKDSGVNQKISTIGYGDMYPIIDDKNDNKNSRVEIKIRR